MTTNNNDNLYNENDFEKAMNSESFFKLTKESAYNLYVSLFNKYQETKKQNEVLRQMLKSKEDEEQQKQQPRKLEEFYEERKPPSSSSSSSSNVFRGFSNIAYQRSSLVKDVHKLLKKIAPKPKTEKVQNEKFKEFYKGFMPRKDDGNNDNDNKSDDERKKQTKEIQTLVKDSFYNEDKDKIIIMKQEIKENPKEINYQMDNTNYKYDMNELNSTKKEIKELKLLTKKMLREKDNDTIGVVQKVLEKANEQTEMKMPLINPLDVFNKQILEDKKHQVIEEKMNKISNIILKNKNILQVIYDICVEEQKQRKSNDKYETQTNTMKIKNSTLMSKVNKQIKNSKLIKETIDKSKSIRKSKTYMTIDMGGLKEEAKNFQSNDDDDDDDNAADSGASDGVADAGDSC